MSIRAFSHVAVGVRDMERSLRFYRDVIGLQISADQPEQFPGLDGGAPIKRRGVYLRWKDGPDASFLVLDQQLSRASFGEPPRVFEVGTHHFGFWVDDLDAIAERARAAGFELLTQPGNADSRDYGEAPGKKIRSCFLFDPDQNVVQVDQRL